MKKHVLLV